MGTVYKLKIDDQGNMAKVISIMKMNYSCLNSFTIRWLR